MYAGIADTINRRFAQAITGRLDKVDADMVSDHPDITPWYRSVLADTLMGDNPETTDAERAWFVGFLAAGTPGIEFDGHPADEDWENLFSHFRAEIEARRDPKIPHGEAAKVCSAGVV